MAKKQLQHLTMLVWLLLVWVCSAINPFSQRDWLLENLLVFVFAGLMIVTYKKLNLSLCAYWLLTLFMTLHLIGAHYTYAQTPLGFWAQDLFHLSRNHYDRLVHFSFGLLLVTPILEILGPVVKTKKTWLNLISLSVILSLSALYEIMEMLTAIIVNPELGAAFLGTQGDEWDAQKDTGLALAGAVLTIVFNRYKKWHLFFSV